MAQSRFISLSPYCLVEYIFEPLGSSNFLTEDFTLVKNEDTGLLQIFNKDESFNKTKNIQDVSVIPIGNNRVAYADSEKLPNYIDYDENLSSIDVDGYNVVYDKVRFHFVSGFDFEGFEALILSIRNNQNDGGQHLFANILFSRETAADLITLNSKPLFLSDTTFDRYIEFKIPSIKNINEEYNLSPSPEITFVANITPKHNGSIGFITNSPITLSLSECSRRIELPTDVGTKYTTFEISDNYISSVSQTNEFDGVGAYVNESSDGDFIEYYLTFNSGFPEELISILNRRNPSDDWFIIHQLSIFEQVGSSFINTSRQIIFQEDGWDEPLLFRPVLKNANIAVSMSIDLLCRLTNKRTGEQIIREASFSMISPKKYGKNLSKIPLLDEPQSHKIYNKIIKKNFESTKLFIEPQFAPGFETELSTQEIKEIKSVEYVPVFMSNNNISISNNSGYLKVRDLDDEVIFGPGSLRFIISPFDNAVKFKMFNVINKKAIPLDLNLNSAKYNLVFETDSGKISIGNSNSDKLENLSTGVLLFNIPKKKSEEIYKSSKQTVYVTSVAQDSKETLMYTGEWRRSDQQDSINIAIEQERNKSNEILARDERIRQLESKLAKLESEKKALKFNVKPNALIKSKAKAPVVNRIGVPKPKSITTNISNAGAKVSKKDPVRIKIPTPIIKKPSTVKQLINKKVIKAPPSVTKTVKKPDPISRTIDPRKLTRRF